MVQIVVAAVWLLLASSPCTYIAKQQNYFGIDVFEHEGSVGSTGPLSQRNNAKWGLNRKTTGLLTSIEKLVTLNYYDTQLWPK